MYKWKVDPANGEAFEREWSEGTQKIYETLGSLGSSLHKAENGIYVAYARWPTRDLWQRMWDARTGGENSLGELVEGPIGLELLIDHIEKEPYRTKC
jgi:hypothetical protein